MKIIFEAEFERGDIVYLKTDPDQHPRIVTGYRLPSERSVLYILQYIASETEHYLCELSGKKNDPINHLIN